VVVRRRRRDVAAGWWVVGTDTDSNAMVVHWLERRLALA
jgi:hypothetical protein